MFRPKLAYEPLSLVDCKVISLAKSVPRGVEVGQVSESKTRRGKIQCRGPMQKQVGSWEQQFC